MDSYLERLQRELEDAIAGATAADLTQGPSGKWSPAQILEHLYLTYKNTNKGIGKCLEKGAPLVARATVRNRIAKMMIVNFSYVPGGFKAPERACPRGMSAEEVLQAVFPEIQQMEAGFAELERRFGANVEVLNHPLLGPLCTEHWRKFHYEHGRHHARQIRQRLVRTSRHSSAN